MGIGEERIVDWHMIEAPIYPTKTLKGGKWTIHPPPRKSNFQGGGGDEYMVEKKNIAAIWLGNFTSVESFREFLEPDYDLEDDEALEAIYSPFRIAFKMFDSYDDDFVDKVVSDDKMSELSISKLLGDIEFLKGKEFPKDNPQYNCAYVIFDYEYDEQIESYFSKEGNEFVFYKNIECDTSVDLSWMGL
ncbi:hypothetical protein Hs30E_20470 [Lactococcus hodotermopsidis]|uniref:Uncharacterized protein n=1 Tax=Pseudolactococcus hodotermopsidis TaxID=2709157 RepID=A0A6A0BGM8_9LACT|nr:immunity 22 family protein [Lactococcus hodotermopsidis]GFH43518.1 hypothetical protein Hs30E_20470 [Lactococcus hodotermopsidis]